MYKLIIFWSDCRFLCSRFQSFVPLTCTDFGRTDGEEVGRRLHLFLLKQSLGKAASLECCKDKTHLCNECSIAKKSLLNKCNAFFFVFDSI